MSDNKCCVFTVVANNYVSQAVTLGDSLKKTNPQLDFYIFVSDKREPSVSFAYDKYKVTPFCELPDYPWEDMAFKYNVIEYSTAIKPFCFDYLFCGGYEKVIYLDPDTYVYEPLDLIYKFLDENFIVLTPHAIKPQLHDDGVIKEEDHLFEGIFNCGFVAINNSDNGRYITEWWKIRLEKSCYADRLDALHVDQKWMDYVPSMFDSGVLIARHAGMNVSHWNMHERTLSVRDGKYYFDDDKLVFFHFSGYEPLDENAITKPNKQTRFTLNSYPEYRPLFDEYRCHLLENKYQECVSIPYSYNYFDNGVVIMPLHKRLYRIWSQTHNVCAPFSAQGEFYKLLASKKLLDMSATSANYSQVSQGDVSKKILVLEYLFKFCKSALGVKRYYLFIKAIRKMCRDENQIFLVK